DGLAHKGVAPHLLYQWQFPDNDNRLGSIAVGDRVFLHGDGCARHSGCTPSWANSRPWISCSSSAAAVASLATASTSLTSALTSPGCGDSNKMRLPMRMASAMECVTNMTVNRVSSHSCRSSSCI